VPGHLLALTLLGSASALVLPSDPQGSVVFALFGYSLIAVTMSLLLVFVLHHAASDNLLCRGLRSGPLVRIGQISYMFYLLHLFVIRMFRDWAPSLFASHWALNRMLVLGGSLAATLGLAALSWRYFEAPILRLKSRFDPAHHAPRIRRTDTEASEVAGLEMSSAV
jgi:peptidoglycan/LPS O-acetylase OafA/YrhL